MSSDQKFPLVSVIIPCYNHEKFVQECIQSVIDQDYQNIELIIIDDGSQDHSVQKIEEMINLCQERFKRFEFRYHPNKGLCATLNEGLDWIQGKYVCSMASDDIWVKEKTTVQVNYLNNNPDCIGIFSSIILIDSDGWIGQKLKVKYKKYNFKSIFLHRFFLPAPTAMCRVQSIKSTGGYNETLKIEDWGMWLSLTLNGGTLDCLNKSLAYYRRHDNNTSNQLEMMHEERLKIIELFRSHPLYKQALSAAYMILVIESDQQKILLLIKAILISPISLCSRKFIGSLVSLIKKFL